MFIYSARTTAKTAATLAAVAMVVCGSTVAHGQEVAQDGTDERLLACDGIRDPAEKMACFDAVVKSLRQTDDAPTVESLSARAPTSESPAAALGATAAVPATPPIAEPAMAVSGAVATSNRAEPATEDEKFGLEDTMAEAVREKKEEEKSEIQSVQATIVEVWPTIDQRFEVRLDNGQVWRETSGSRIRMPKEGSTVQIKRGRLGSYRMKIDDDNRLASVRRTK